jgi:hypothetical protein
MTLEAVIDYIHADLTMSCSLPTILPINEIKRLVVKDAAPWFYENYKHTVIRSYYYIPKKTMETEEFTRYKYITVPDSIQSVTWVYNLKTQNMFELGWGGAPNLSIGVGVTSNQQYLSSALTSIGELGVYKTIIDGFASELNNMTKQTLQYDFNFASKQLHLLTSVHSDVILETYDRIAEEDLYEMDKFRRYALALCKQQLGRMLTRYNFNLPGGIQMNGDAIKTEGEQELAAIREEIKGQSQTGWFMLIR